jgi:hypothetical protein
LLHGLKDHPRIRKLREKLVLRRIEESGPYPGLISTAINEFGLDIKTSPLKEVVEKSFKKCYESTRPDELRHFVNAAYELDMFHGVDLLPAKERQALRRKARLIEILTSDC